MDKIERIKELYNEGIECLESLSILEDETKDRDRLYEILRELRDIQIKST